jgi:toxin ParE1/3/4
VKLRSTRLARADINSAYDYIAVNSVAAADQFLKRVQQAAGMLVRHPMAGRPYRIRRGFVDILAVIHGARKWPDDL